MIKKVYLHGVGVNHEQEGAGGLAYDQEGLVTCTTINEIG